MTYAIGEVSKMTGIPISAIRYYDSEGLLPFLKRKQNGIREFDEKDLDHLKLIECLKATNMPIKDIKQFFDWYLTGDSTLKNRQALFHQGRATIESEISKLEVVLNTLKYKSWVYDLAVEKGYLDAYKEVPREELPEEAIIYEQNKVGRE